MRNNPILYIVIPCYNEEEIIYESCITLVKKLEELINVGQVSSESKLCFVDDGSIDRTWEMLEDIKKKEVNYNPYIKGIKLSKNCGHQSALLAGINYSAQFCEVTITIDADLQQDIEVLGDFLNKYKSGAEIVYGIRNDRKTDGLFKKISALVFYKLMKLFGTKTIKNHADYRLLSKNAIMALQSYKEVNLFLRGVIPLLGYKSDKVYFDVKDRKAGTSKYTLKKMIAFALDGVTSLSITPIRFITGVGFGIFILSIFMILYFVFGHFQGNTIQGWTSILCSVWLLGGLILLAIGVIGEYISKVYLETKQRPIYFIEKFLPDDIEEK